jgi:hypothetical protein
VAREKRGDAGFCQTAFAPHSAQRMKRQADKGRSDRSFQDGEWVFPQVAAIRTVISSSAG